MAYASVAEIKDHHSEDKLFQQLTHIAAEGDKDDQIGKVAEASQAEIDGCLERWGIEVPIDIDAVGFPETTAQMLKLWVAVYVLFNLQANKSDISAAIKVKHDEIQEMVCGDKAPFLLGAPGRADGEPFGVVDENLPRDIEPFVFDDQVRATQTTGGAN